MRLRARHGVTDGMLTLDKSQMGDAGTALSTPRRVASLRGLSTLTLVLAISGAAARVARSRLEVVGWWSGDGVVGGRLRTTNHASTVSMTEKLVGR